ncbi:MAG: DUF1564 family protein [Leptospiraceae bacterium]|nr:DUF1564 family protein [Leptospiraceae bacterium]
MIHFQNSKSFPISNLRDLDISTSTLLIPEYLLADLQRKMAEYGNSLPIYFLHLLRRFRIFNLSGMIPPPRKIKTEFQDEGLNLHKFNFRVSNAAWIELGELSLAFGKSRCALFVYLLELDIAGFGDVLVEAGMGFGVPINRRLILKASWLFEYVFQDYVRSYHVRD